MIDGLKPYPKYKDSGVPWLGEVPEHWGVLPGRALFREINDRGHPDEELLSVTISHGVVRQADLLSDSSKKDSSNEDKSAYKLVEPGDIAYNKMRAWQGAVGISAYRGIVSPAYIVQRLRNPRNSPQYIHYLLRTPSFTTEAERSSYGITSDQWSLRAEDFRKIYFSVPGPDEQTAIVRFLDWADHRIRRVIRAREKRIKLLEEYKQALINQIVTGKIDVRTGKPYPKYKDSSVPWLGEVPEHWEIVRIKFIAQLKTGESITAQHIEERGAFPVYGGNGVRGFTSSYTHEGEFVLIGRQGALCGNINYAYDKFWASEHAVVAHPKKDIAVKWFGELLRSMNLNQYSIAAAQPGLAIERIQNLQIPFPRLSEQNAIAKYIDERTAKIDTAIFATRREIELLKEFRTRLIADVVTGKLDVREVAAKLPDKAPGEKTLEGDEVESATGDSVVSRKHVDRTQEEINGG